MSQQINLYDPSLLRKRELLTVSNLAIAAGALVLIFGAWGGFARTRLHTLEGESQALAPQAMSIQAQKDAMTGQLNAMKPDPQLEAELAEARALLDLHTKQIGELKKGLGPEAGGFAEYLRGFARQAPTGLWLTGFTIKDSGASMEIHGRMTDPALLPEYVRRLNGEQAFKGREFAALAIRAGRLDSSEPAPSSPAAQAAQPSPTPAPAAAEPAPFYEFTLTPVSARSRGALGAALNGVGQAVAGAQR